MPRPRKKDAPSRFSFVAVQPDRDDVNWVRVYSGSARAHAAYWGDSSRIRGDVKHRSKDRDRFLDVPDMNGVGKGSHIDEALMLSDGSSSPSSRLDSFTHGSRDNMLTRADGARDGMSMYGCRDWHARTGTPLIEFTATIPAFLSPYHDGVGFPARDSDRYSQFFIEKVVPRVTARQGTAFDNPYLSFAIPASMESALLRHAMYALTASQVAPLSANPGLESWKALWHKQNVIHLLRDDLAGHGLPSSASLVACYIMLIFEIRHSKARDWAQWLQGAILLIERRDRLDQDVRESGVWSTFTKNIVVHETLSAVSSHSGARLSRRYWKSYLRSLCDGGDDDEPSEDLILHKCREDRYFETLRGCPTVVLLVLAEIMEHLEFVERGGSTISTRRKYQRWEGLLLRCHSSSSDESMIHLAESFRYATLVYLHRRVLRLPHTDSHVQGYVHLALDHIACLDSAKPGFNATWPKMLAGLELDEIQFPHLAARLLQDVRTTHLVRTNLCKDRSHDESEQLLLSTWLQRRQCRTWKEMIAVDWLDIALVGGREMTIW